MSDFEFDRRSEVNIDCIDAPARTAVTSGDFHLHLKSQQGTSQ